MRENCRRRSDGCCGSRAIETVSTHLTFKDRLGGLKVRLGIGRMRYTVSPGLYAVGAPDEKSPVLVSANYKLTFDALRKELSGANCRLLLLDTKGVNVWCAAGKKTFGTSELIHRIEAVKLPEVVAHRKLIVPQLGAPGVSAHEITRRTGFSVIYGP
ncbi:MAG: acetyl-CoA synthase subunit gamma, partial [Deltaproteobacteria bacterium]|nr:acetyl-CoA synthase subunit gamma [Deltaproteobacteria bacterium]